MAVNKDMVVLSVLFAAAATLAAATKWLNNVENKEHGKSICNFAIRSIQVNNIARMFFEHDVR